MKKLTFFTTLIITLLLGTVIFPQVTQQWIKTYNGPGSNSDNASKVVSDVFGNVYVAGHGNGTTSVDIFVIKYNSSGILQWSQVYNGTEDGIEQASDIAVDEAGNVYISGKSYNTATNFDYLTIKYNSAGNLIWFKTYNGPGNGEDKTVGIKVDNAGNVYVTGTSLGIANNDYTTIKYSPDGSELWTARFNGSYNYRDDAIDIDVDRYGNVYVTGFSYGQGYDYATLKYSTDGILLWEKRYSETTVSHDYPMAMVLDKNGNICVTGYSVNTTGSDYATIKYSSSGEELWIMRYNHTSNLNDEPADIAVDSYGNIFVTGNSLESSGNPDYLTIKYSPSGNQEWVQRYNGSGNNADYAKSIVTDCFGNSYITGFSYTTTQYYNYVTIKYNPEGIQQWIQGYDGPMHSEDNAVSIAIGSCNNIYVTGKSNNGAPSGFDIVTIKYLQPPCPPNLISPENNYIGANLTPTLDWEPSPEAVSYTLQVSINSSFTNMVINISGISIHEYSVPVNLLATNTKYYWRVNAINAAGTGDWSEIYNFLTYSTPSEKIQMLMSTIDSLRTVGILNKGQANSLITKLSTALKRIIGNDYKGAINNIKAFRNEVEDLVATQILPPAIGNNLIERADQLINQLNGMLVFDNTGFLNGNPSDYSLGQNYPNPFNPSTTIRFGIKKQESGISGVEVKLTVFDITGKNLATLVNETLKEGYYEFTFNGDNLSSGVYFYKLTAGTFTSVKKMVLMK